MLTDIFFNLGPFGQIPRDLKLYNEIHASDSNNRLSSHLENIFFNLGPFGHIPRA